MFDNELLYKIYLGYPKLKKNYKSHSEYSCEIERTLLSRWVHYYDILVKEAKSVSISYRVCVNLTALMRTTRFVAS